MNVTFIIPYFGKWPVWMPVFLDSCRHNPNFSWKLFGDHEVSYELPPNVKYAHWTLEDLLTSLPYGVVLNKKEFKPYKLCDFKPVYSVYNFN